MDTASLLLNSITSAFTSLHPEVFNVEHIGKYINRLDCYLSSLMSYNCPFIHSAPMSIVSDIDTIRSYLKTIFRENGYNQKEKTHILSLFTFHYRISIIPEPNNFYNIRTTVYTKYLEDVDDIILQGHGSSNTTVFIPDLASEDDILCVGRTVSESILKQVRYW